MNDSLSPCNRSGSSGISSASFSRSSSERRYAAICSMSSLVLIARPLSERERAIRNRGSAGCAAASRSRIAIAFRYAALAGGLSVR